MSLESEVREAVSRRIHQSSGRFFISFSGGEAKILSQLYDMGLIDEPFIDETVKEAVLGEALRTTYRVATDRSRPDYWEHTMYPEIIALGIMEGRLTRRQIRRIIFPDAHTPETFCTEYNPTKFLEGVKDKLLGRQVAKFSGSSGDSCNDSCAGDCGCMP